MIIEAYRPNAVAAIEYYANDPNIDVVATSIQEAIQNDRLWDSGWDTCLWSHGPEHVSTDELRLILPKLFSQLHTLFLAWCPHGNYYGEDADNHNPWQRHRIIVPTPDIFHVLNLDLTIGTCDIENSPNALIWMYKWLQEHNNET